MKIGIAGCAGRMGRFLAAEALAAKGCELAGGIEPAGSEFIGMDIGELAGARKTGLLVSDDAAALFSASDAVIDFTAPSAVPGFCELAAAAKAAYITGTTGLLDQHMRALRQAALKCAVVQSANMSIGVNLLAGLTRQAAGLLGDEYDIEIAEMHHRHKVDAPSGTALALGQAAAAGRGIDLQTASQRTRDGHIGPRQRGHIGFATLRGGDVVGEHTVIFAADGERIELTHKASSRKIFASGAIRAALWAHGKAPGLYSMRDVLGL